MPVLTGICITRKKGFADKNFVIFNFFLIFWTSGSNLRLIQTFFLFEIMIYSALHSKMVVITVETSIPGT